MSEAAPYRRRVPAKCLDLAHEFEKGPDGKSFAVTNYLDQGVPAIGWGHRIPNSADPLLHQCITLADADALAMADYQDAGDEICASFREDAERIIGTLTEDQYAALCDLVFNIGAGRFEGSTLYHFLLTGQPQRVGDEFPRWVYVRKKLSTTLGARREAEKALWNGAGWP